MQTVGRRYSADPRLTARSRRPWVRPTVQCRLHGADPPSGEIHCADPPSPAGLQRTHSLISPASSSSPRHLPAALLHTGLGLADLDLALYSEALESRRRAKGTGESRCEVERRR
jgi:hypothetical protein